MCLMSYRTNVLDVKQFSFEGIENALLFGIELETKAMPSKEQIELVNSSPSWIAKKDSSVEAEYVSVPMKLHEVKYKLVEIVEVIRNVKADDHTGMHVHVNKSFFNDKNSITAFINLINGAVMDKHPLIERDVNYYADINSYGFSGRYQVVNITDKTLEVRIFKATSDMCLIYDRLEWLAKLALLVNRDPKLGFMTDKYNGVDLTSLLDLEEEKEKLVKQNKLLLDNYNLFDKVEELNNKVVDLQVELIKKEQEKSRLATNLSEVKSELKEANLIYYIFVFFAFLIGGASVYRSLTAQAEIKTVKQQYADTVLTQVKERNKNLSDYISCGATYDEGTISCSYSKYKLEKLKLDASTDIQEDMENNPHLYLYQWSAD